MENTESTLLLLGGHRALDFLNTWCNPGTPVETIGDGAAFGQWLVVTRSIDESELARVRRREGAAALDAAAAEARRFREWTREWLKRWRRFPAGRHAKEIDALNQLLAREDRNRQLIVGRGGLELREVPAFDSAAALVALPAADVADLVTREAAELVRECAGDPCTLWFLDRTRSHRRRFCSATACGNRSKVAAFRERQRD